MFRYYGEVLRNEHIYYNFRIEELRSKLFLYKIITWDDKNEKGYTDNSKLTKFKALLVLIFISFICLDTLYFIIFVKDQISKFDFFIIVSCIASMILQIMLNVQTLQIQKHFSIAIHLLQIMDSDLSMYYSYSKTNRWVNHAAFGLGLLIIAGGISLIACIVIFFTYLSFKPGTSLWIIVMYYAPYHFFLAVVRLLLYDRLTLLNIIIKNYANNHRKSAAYHVCDSTVKLKCFVCKKHLIEFVGKMHKTILIICRTLNDLDTIITVKAGCVELLNAPGFVVIFIARLMHTETGLHIFNICVAINAAVILFIYTTFFFIVSEKICNELADVQRALHKLYFQAPQSVIVKGNLTTISTIMLKERVKFTFAEFFLIDPKTLLAVISSVVQMGVLVLQLDL